MSRRSRMRTGRETEIADKIVEQHMAKDPATKRCVKDASDIRSHMWDHRKISNHGHVSGMGRKGYTMHTARIPQNIFYFWMSTFGHEKMRDPEFIGPLIRRYQKAFGTGGSSSV